MKGIVLAGGSGTRLHPLTLAVSKQLQPIYDKPMIYYPLSTLMLGGIREILVITRPVDQPLFRNLLGDGSEWGISLSYAVQAEPRGLAESFTIGAEFIANEPVCLILGDNLFYSEGLGEMLDRSVQLTSGAKIFAYRVRDPENYGVVSLSPSGQVMALEEKPKNPTSNLAIPGIYFYDHHVVEVAGNLRPSPRCELEITDVNRQYLARNALAVELLGRGTAWLDTGTHDALLQAGNFIQTVETRQGLKIGCPEEIAYRKGFIDRDQLERLGERFAKTAYGQYLKALAQSSSAA